MVFFSEEVVEAEETEITSCQCDTYGCQDGAGNNTGCDD